ncbi:hypothetical protein MMC16_004796 [Acarospora aff. strigata]|nr:hypothetical protein [Acarospora aff. strigata]
MSVPSAANTLDEFCSLLKGRPSRNPRATLRHVIHSLVRIISAEVNNLVRAQEILRFIANVLDTNLFILGDFDNLLDSYWKIRILMGLNHDESLRTLSAALGSFKPSGLPTPDRDDDSSAPIEYGCTFEDCNEVFGKKNAWKRHESSQHFQLERWRCRQIDGSSNFKQCANLSWRRDDFQHHLENKHDIDKDHFDNELDACHLGANGALRFWCGFCGATISLLRKGLEAWDERFDHIESHYASRQNVKDWIPVDGCISKREQEVLDARTMLYIQGDSLEFKKLEERFAGMYEGKGCETEEDLEQDGNWVLVK